MDLSSSMIIPGLYGGQVDLVNWLEDQDTNTSEVQGFHEGAKETYGPSVQQSGVGVKQRFWATPEETLEDAIVSPADLLADLSAMDECLSVNLSDDACLAKLTGEDAAWARGVAEGWKKLQQQHKMVEDEEERKMLEEYFPLKNQLFDDDFQQKKRLFDNVQQKSQLFEDHFQQEKQLFEESETAVMKQQLFGDDVEQYLLNDYPHQVQIDDFSQEDFMSNEPNCSPFADSSYCDSPFSSGSGITGSPNSDLYSSLDYQTTLSPEYQTTLSPEYQQETSTNTSEYQKVQQQPETPEYILADVIPEYKVSSIVAYENELNGSFKEEEATIEIDHHDYDVICDEEVYQGEMKFKAEPTPNSSPVRVKIISAVSDRNQKPNQKVGIKREHSNDPSIIYCKRVNVGQQGKKMKTFIGEEKPLLKDIISNKGDDIMKELLSSPESTCGNYDSVDESMASPAVSGIIFDDSESDDFSVASSSGKRVPFTVTERRLRKKEQNKRAAIRYREKKKSEMEIVTEEHQQTLILNKKLQEEKKKVLAEFAVIRSLLVEKYGIGQ